MFLQAYRPGGLAKKGFGPEDVARMRPGVVYASLTAHQRGGTLGDMKGVSLVFFSHFPYQRIQRSR